MAQIDSYLKRLVAENELNYLDDFLDLYDFIPNEDLKTLLAVYHTQLNHWFAVLNHDMRIATQNFALCRKTNKKEQTEVCSFRYSAL